jgi:hypothetical protein
MKHLLHPDRPLWKEYVDQQVALQMAPLYAAFGSTKETPMSNPVQTVLRFVEESREELLKFEKFWLDMAAQSPDAFPLEMHAGEWNEQFLSWNETAPDKV